MSKLITANANLEAAIKQAADTRRRGRQPLPPSAKPSRPMGTNTNPDYVRAKTNLINYVNQAWRAKDADVIPVMGEYIDNLDAAIAASDMDAANEVLVEIDQLAGGSVTDAHASDLVAKLHKIVVRMNSADKVY